MDNAREGRAFARDMLAHRPHDAAVALTEIPGITSAILGEDGIYIVRFDRSRVTDDELLATMDRLGLEVVARDDLQGSSDVEARAEEVGASTATPVAGAVEREGVGTVSVQLRGGPLDGESRLMDGNALMIDEPLTLVERDAAHEADVPGVVGIMEYLYRGDGVADYVGGLPANGSTDQ
jgi:hypothetical protein